MLGTGGRSSNRCFWNLIVRGMADRRVAALALLLIVGWRAMSSPGSAASVCQSLDPSPSLQQFVDPLPFSPAIDLSTSSSPSITLGAYKITQKLHRDLPPTTLYAFGSSSATATFPGPTLLAQQHVPAHVRWENHIVDDAHMFQVDVSLTWASPPQGGVPTVVHLHGGEVESESDGHPESWFTSKGDTGPTFTSQNHTYINEQPAMTLWYHDHTMGITRLNVVAGLSGLYIITSEAERAQLPLGIPLVIQDRQFYSDGSINFPIVGILPEYHSNWCPEYYGDTMLVNGKVWPYLKVLPKPYRFRILNACNARFISMTLDNPLLLFYQIGTDGGFLEDGGWNLTSITMAPAERVDVIIDFSGLQNGTSVVLNNSGPTPFPSGDISQMPHGTKALLQFVVVEEGGLDEGVVEVAPIDMASLLEPIAKPLSIDNVTQTRMLGVVEWDNEDHMPLVFTLDNKTWEEPVTQSPTMGETELWEFMNLRINAHPIHVHLVQFKVLNQQTFSNRSFEEGSCSVEIPYGEDGSCYTSLPRDPYMYQRGWKDTVTTWPNVVTRVLIRFAQRSGMDFGFDPSVGPGYAWHCHIVDHEDNVMMRPFKVQIAITNLTTTTSALSSSYDRVL